MIALLIDADGAERFVDLSPLAVPPPGEYERVLGASVRLTTRLGYRYTVVGANGAVLVLGWSDEHDCPAPYEAESA